MPILKIHTNVVWDPIVHKDFLQQAGVAFQETIAKPMANVAVHIHPDQVMSFGGTTEPCALIDFISAGKISKEENIKYSKAITELIGKLGVAPNRMYIVFVDMARDNVGINGTVLSAM